MDRSPLEHKIRDKEFTIGVLGLGYVGLPLAVEYAGHGIDVTGFDISSEKIAHVNNGQNYIDDVDDARLKELVLAGKIQGTTDLSRIGEPDVLFICVPTPISLNKEPDISHVRDAARSIAKELRPQQLVILKSTTFPETTERKVMPILEERGLKAGRDFFLAYSPERIDPGRKNFTTANTPVIVGGVTKTCTKLAAMVSEIAISQVVPVSSPRVAEMSKLLENIFRSVNIALVNELAQLCDRMGNINIWEVVQAAATKPFGFMPFYPGPGIGGHCILVDPYYLAWKAKEFDFHSDFIELAAKTNENMPFYVMDLIIRSLSLAGVSLKTANLLFLGVAFKKNVDDIRNSPALRIMELLLQRGVQNISYNDPYVREIRINGNILTSKNLEDNLINAADCIVVTTDHDDYDFKRITKEAKLIVDTRNATFGHEANNVVRLGSGPLNRQTDE